MRVSTGIQVAIFLVAVAAGMYLVVTHAYGWADWLVFGVIVMAAVGGAIAVNHRRFLPQGTKRSFTRDSSSRW